MTVSEPEGSNFCVQAGNDLFLFARQDGILGVLIEQAGNILDLGDDTAATGLGGMCRKHQFNRS